VVAGKFDYYICRADDGRRGRGNSEVPDLLRKALMDNGVSEDLIKIIPDEIEAVDAALNMCEPDDLLLLFGDNIARTWKQIIYFNRPQDSINDDQLDAKEVAPAQLSKSNDDISDPLADAVSVEDAPKIPESMLLSGTRMVRDERGVRLEDTGDEDGD